MRKLQKVAVVAAMLAGMGFVGAGSAFADDGGHGGDEFNVWQSNKCDQHNLDLNILGNVGLLDGVLGNGLNGKGDPGDQDNSTGSNQVCNNSAFEK
jgi:hypothetical protein